jgi:hypothetical protein
MAKRGATRIEDLQAERYAKVFISLLIVTIILIGLFE